MSASALFSLCRLLLPAALGLLALRGCPGELPKPGPLTAGMEEALIHPAVRVRKLPVRGEASHVRVLDVDLAAPGVRVEIGAEGIARRDGRITGRARPVAEWVEQTGAMAGINGGFFGESAGPEYLEIVGLLKLNGKVRVAGPIYHSGSGTDYARSAFGVGEDGRPLIGWITSRRGDPQSLFAHPAAELEGRGEPWRVREAVACGPRLIRDGKIDVSYRGERLASPGRLPRTFLGFNGSRLVLAAATGMEFAECARFLQGYFREAHGAACREAMCLDGGASTQAAWREGGQVRTDSPLNVEVPTAVLVYGK